MPSPVVYKTHYNGDMRIDNVPYIRQVTNSKRTGKEDPRNDYISYEVLKNLAMIYKYMAEHQLTQMDYQEFISIRNFEEEEPVMPKQKLMDLDLKNQKEVIQYVKTEWLDKYFEWKLQSHSSNREVQESAKTQLEFFHKQLQQLSELHQKIITMKYLQMNESGRFTLDDFIYQSLHISRSNYYLQKKKALYLLGLALITGKH